MERKNLISLISLTASLLLIFFLIDPLWNSIGILKTEIGQTQKELDNSEKLIAKTKELEQVYQELKEQADKISLALPRQEDLSFLLVQLESLCSANGLLLESINFVSFDESEKEINFGSPSLNLKADLVGSYESLKNFLSALDKGIRLMDVETINLNISKSAQEEISLDIFEFTLGIKVYLLNN